MRQRRMQKANLAFIRNTQPQQQHYAPPAPPYGTHPSYPGGYAPNYDAGYVSPSQHYVPSTPGQMYYPPPPGPPPGPPPTGDWKGSSPQYEPPQVPQATHYHV